MVQADLLLLALEVKVGELVSRLDKKGRRAHRRFEYLEFQDFICGQVFAALHEGVLDQEPGQRFGGVVGG